MKLKKLRKLMTNEFLSLNKRIEFADIKQAEVALETTTDIRLSAGIKIEVDDTEFVWPIFHQGE